MTILITFILIILFFRLVMPHLLRWAIKAFVKKTIRNGTFMNASGPFAQPGPAPHAPPESDGKVSDGKVKVDYVPRNDRKTRAREFRGGEYVDYEEVK